MNMASLPAYHAAERCGEYELQSEIDVVHSKVMNFEWWVQYIIML